MSLILLTLLAGLLDLGPIPAGGARFLLVRHGQAFSNLEPEPALSPAELDRLTPLGHQQGQAAAKALLPLGARRVLSSPAGRAREMAEDVRAGLSAPPVIVDARLRPLELGRDSDWDKRIAIWERGEDTRPEAGESLDDLGRRMQSALQALAKESPGTQVVAVAHSEVIGALVGLLRALPPAKRYPWEIANGSITVVDVDAHGRLALRLANHVPQ